MKRTDTKLIGGYSRRRSFSDYARAPYKLIDASIQWAERIMKRIDQCAKKRSEVRLHVLICGASV
jgi:hypothetical protein